MKRISIAAAAALLMLGTAQAQQAPRAQAASPWYGELGYSFLQVEDDIGFKAKPQAIRGIVGYNFHPNLAAEGMLAFGTSSDSDMGVDVKVRHAYGLFAKPKYEINNLELFGRLGWVRNKVRASALGVTVSDSDDDFAWGLGANYSINPRTYVGADFMRYFDKDGTKVDGVTLSVGYRF